MNIYLIAFFLLPLAGMISAVVIMVMDKKVRDGQRPSGLR